MLFVEDQQEMFSEIPRELHYLILTKVEDLADIRNLIKALYLYIDYEELFRTKYPAFYKNIKFVGEYIKLDVEYEWNVIYRECLYCNILSNYEGYCDSVVAVKSHLLCNIINAIYIYYNHSYILKYLKFYPDYHLKFVFIYEYIKITFAFDPIKNLFMSNDNVLGSKTEDDLLTTVIDYSEYCDSINAKRLVTFILALMRKYNFSSELKSKLLHFYKMRRKDRDCCEFDDDRIYYYRVENCVIEYLEKKN